MVRTLRFALMALVVAFAAAACGADDLPPRRSVPDVAAPGSTASPTVPTPASSNGFQLPPAPALIDVPLVDAPSYLFLFTHTEDQFNHELSEERYWRVGAMLEELSDAYPAVDFTWTIEFMGADAEAVLERNSETGLVDYLLSLNQSGLVEFGYHAHHDPTYSNRPQVSLTASSTYQEAYDALYTWITCRKDPVLGGCLDDRGGGIDAILAAFGQVEVVTGLGYGEGVQIERSAGSEAVRQLLPDRLLGFGFPDHGSIIRDREYVEARDALLALLTPTHETSSAVFWMDNAIRINDSASLEGVQGGPLREGPAAVTAALDAVDGTRSFVINVGVADKYHYTVASTSPTKWAYIHPESPELPPDLLVSDMERERSYAMTEQSLRYLAERLSSDPGAFQFVSSDQVVALYTSEDYWDVDPSELEQMSHWMLNKWDGRPPDWIYDGEDFYSLADAFALFADALSGVEPTETRVSNTVGPWSSAVQSSEEITVDVTELRSLLAAGLVADGHIAETYFVGGHELTPTQVLYALGYLYAAERAGVSLPSVAIPATETAPATLTYLDAMGCSGCLDTAWSLKPARSQDAADSSD